MSGSFLSTSQKGRRLDIAGIENAILDLLVLVDDSTLEELGLHKGTMKLVETQEQAKILAAVGELEPEIEAGGSCANVLRMASRLGSVTSYSSAVADDDAGRAFRRELKLHGVRDRVVVVEGVTGTSVILVTPDGERTMNTHLGVCRDYRPEHVPKDEVEASKIFFTTGYVWDTRNQIAAIEAALEAARAGGVRLAVDLADPFAVDRSRRHIEAQIERGLDVVFANTEESRKLTGLEAEEAAREIARRVTVAVVTDGERGAWIASDGQLFHAPAKRVDVVDTTGAGDCFAAGFLHGLAAGLDLERCGVLATLLAADTITHLGVRLSPEVVAKARHLLVEPA